MYNDEKHIQIQIADYIRLQYPFCLFTIAPAGQTRGSKIQRLLAGRDAKRMGYRRGCPDIMIFERTNEWGGLFVEVKTMTGAKKPEQKEFINDLNDRGYCACFCRGFDQAKEVIDQYMMNRIMPEGRKEDKDEIQRGCLRSKV